MYTVSILLPSSFYLFYNESCHGVSPTPGSEIKPIIYITDRRGRRRENEDMDDQQDGGAERVEAVADRVTEAKAVVRCTCEDFCLRHWSDKEIEDIREQHLSLEKSELDLVILGKISACISNGESVSTNSHAATPRQRSRTWYSHEGK